MTAIHTKLHWHHCTECEHRFPCFRPIGHNIRCDACLAVVLGAKLDANRREAAIRAAERLDQEEFLQ